METLTGMMEPSFLLALLVAVSVFATLMTLVIPYFERGNLEQRMKSVALERDAIRARERARMNAQEKRGSLRHENNRSIRNANLVDIRTTQANLLAHHLIGEPFANELDESILITVRQLMSSPNYYDLNLAVFAEEIRETTGAWMHDYWETLLTRNHIIFSFSYRDPLQ